MNGKGIAKLFYNDELIVAITFNCQKERRRVFEEWNRRYKLSTKSNVYFTVLYLRNGKDCIYLDKSTNIFYNTIKEAAAKTNIPYSTLKQRIQFKSKNCTFTKVCI